MEVILEFCNKLTVNIFEVYMILRFLDLVLKHRIADERIRKMIVLVKIVIALDVDYYVPYVWVNFFVSLFLVFLLCCCYQVELKKRIAAAIGINILFAVSELIVAVLIGGIRLGLLERAANEESVAMFLSRLVFWLFVTIFKYVKKEPGDSRLPGKVGMFEAIVLLVMLMELFMVCSLEQRNVVLESIFLLGAEITVYLLIYLYDCLIAIVNGKIQTGLIEKEREYYRREVVMLKENQEATRQFRHDWKNRIQVMSRFAEEKQWDELKEYLSSVSDKMTSMQLYSSTNNPSMDAIINSKLYQASKQGITVKSSVVMPEKIKINEDDLVIILGNLLDNAIEANEYVQGEKEMELALRYENGCFLLHLKNSCEEGISRTDETFVTRKKDKSIHGIGLKSVEETVGRYHGAMDITVEQDRFCVEIIMYVLEG